MDEQTVFADWWDCWDDFVEVALKWNLEIENIELTDDIRDLVGNTFSDEGKEIASFIELGKEVYCTNPWKPDSDREYMVDEWELFNSEKLDDDFINKIIAAIKKNKIYTNENGYDVYELV